MQPHRGRDYEYLQISKLISDLYLCDTAASLLFQIEHSQTCVVAGPASDADLFVDFNLYDFAPQTKLFTCEHCVLSYSRMPFLQRQ
jgi:hypothetical protein